jgi:5-methylcytosine-specific restriction endonuclease McrA
MKERTKATSIPPKVREEVERRDSINGVPACIFCHTTIGVRGESHFIRRSQGGLGIPKNLLTVCKKCHREFDDGKMSELYKEKAREYLKSKYLDWNEEDLVYNKWKGFKYD